MSRIYKRRRPVLRRIVVGKKAIRVPVLDAAGRKRYAVSRVWYVAFTGADDRLKTRRAFASKRASLALAVKLQEEADLERVGLRDRTWREQARPLAVHIEDFRKYLASKGNTAEHVAKTIARVRAIVAGCKWQRLADIRHEDALGYLAGRRSAGLPDGPAPGRRALSVGATNGYIAALRAFARWAERSDRAPRNPLPGLSIQNAEADRRRRRRALSEDELAALLEAAENGPTILSVPGPERVILYRLAVETGFRAAELRSLRVEDLDLNADPPTATIRAGYSKRRREDVQPLRKSFARWLEDRLAALGRDAGPVCVVPERTAEILRRDLKAAGIPEADPSGRVADFHSLRVVFGTRLARAGVHPKVAQDLLRHSTIELTMRVYSMTVLEDRASALEKVSALERTRRPKGAESAGRKQA